MGLVRLRGGWLINEEGCKRAGVAAEVHAAAEVHEEENLLDVTP